MTESTPSPVAPRDPIDCHTAVRRLWDYLDGRLPPNAREEVEAHLRTCEGCPPRFTFAREMLNALAASAPPEVVDAEQAQLRDRVRTALARLAAGD